MFSPVVQVEKLNISGQDYWFYMIFLVILLTVSNLIMQFLKCPNENSHMFI
jgi:hypothetical protein